VVVNTAPALLALALAAAPARGRAATPPIPVFCYVETLFGGVRPDALDLAECTHVIEAFLLPAPTGAVRAANALPRTELLRAARRSGSRVLVAVGGATVPGATFTAIAGRPEALRRFTDGVVRFVLDSGYDGVDLDWEFPAPGERELQARLVRAVRTALDDEFAANRPGEAPLLLVGVTPGAHLEGYDFRALAPHTDFFVQFGYDFRNPALGPWANTARLWPDGSDRPIEASVRGVASELIRRGVPREKLIVSLPLYTGDGRPWVEVRKAALAAPQAVHPLYLESQWEGTWITGPAALEAKVRRVVAGTEIAGGPAAGIALWQLGQQGPYHELTEAVRRATRAAPAPAPDAPRASRRSGTAGRHAP
jgi:hypothetical protein